MRAAYMRPLQVNRKRDMALGCGPGMPGPYRGAMGKRDIIIGYGAGKVQRRRINVADVEFPSAFLLVMTNSFR